MNRDAIGPIKDSTYKSFLVDIKIYRPKYTQEPAKHHLRLNFEKTSQQGSVMKKRVMILKWENRE